MASTPNWDIKFAPAGKTAVVYREHPVSHLIEVNYFTPLGDSYFYTLPVGTKIREFAPNGRLLTSQWSGGSTTAPPMPSRNGVKPKCRKRIPSAWKRASAVALISSITLEGASGARRVRSCSTPGRSLQTGT